MIRISEFPQLVRILCLNHEGWIVGSMAHWLRWKATRGPQDRMGPKPSDWDILVSPWQWGPASRLIPAKTPANSHGGFKVQWYEALPGCSYTETPVVIDVWVGDVGWFLANAPKGNPRLAVHPLSGTVLTASDLPG